MDPTPLDRIASLVGELPALPVVAQQATRLLADPATEPEELQGVLARDAALSLKLLRLANSAYYRRSRQVTTLNAAIVLLGFKTIHTLVLSSAVHRMLDGAGALARPLWTHSFGTALVCRELCRRLPVEGVDGEEAFLAGLFHDVGKGVIAAKLPGAYAHPLESGAEVASFGFQHGDLGRSLLERWEIPTVLAEAVGTHHDPGPNALARHACAADWIAWPLAPGVGVLAPEAPGCDLEALGVGPSLIAEIREVVQPFLGEEAAEP